MEENNTVFKKISELASSYNCIIDISIDTSGTLYIRVLDRMSHYSCCTIINSDCAEELIIDVIKDTTRRTKEV